MQIAEVVKPNDRVKFFPDVQLGWYPARPENEGLARGYMWTSEKVGERISSLDLLDKLRNCLLNPLAGNRLVAMATYGHGKTHLALALANFFGRPKDSSHVKAVLENIQHTAPDRARNFADFKAGRVPFLVLRLSGEEGSLHGQVMLGLQRALAEHPGTQGATLPFWFKKAQAFLENLDGDSMAKANDALVSHGIDVPLLLQEVRKGETQYKGVDLHALCKEAYRATSVAGTLPDFGGEISLREAIEWVCDEFCSEDAASGKPCGGLLILFDEFAKFIEKYFASPRGDSMQNLLNGVDNRRGVCVFVALSQFDPDQTARNIAEQTGRGGDALNSLLQELNRLPLPDRYRLHTSLETVLKSYLAQDPACWGQLMSRPAWIAALQEATNDTMALFEERYGRWDEGVFTETLTKGCFPLHPATAAILAGVELRETTSPRSALAFLQKALQVRGKESVEKNNKPNWVYPTDIFAADILPDFGEMLAPAGNWKQFLVARNRAGNERTDVQEAMLRAVLLHDAVEFKPRRVGGFEALAALLTGYSASVCHEAFEQLRESRTLRYDATNKRWMFPPLGEDDTEVERELDKRVAGQTLDWPTLQALQSEAEKWHLAPLNTFHLDWGNADDWAASQILLTRGTFTPDNLRKLLQVPHVHPSGGLKLPPRGYVVRLLAHTDDDVTYLRENAARVLAEALPDGKKTDKVPPVVVCVPGEARPNLTRLILRRRALPGLRQEKPELGKSAFATVENDLNDKLRQEMERLDRSAKTYEVPQPYHQTVTTNTAGRETTLNSVLRECYNAAYAQRPDELLKQYPYNRTNYRKDVGTLALHLMRNNVGVLETVLKSGPGRSLVFDGNRALVASWHLLSGHGYGVQEPPVSSRARAGWDLLSNAFKPGGGKVALSGLIETLLRPPYGYDPNALTLLLCAWHGLHQGDLSVSIGTRSGSLEELKDNLDNAGKPWDWLWQLCNKGVAWSRRNPDAERAKIRAKIARVQNNETFASDEAATLAAELRHFAGDERETDAALQKAAESCVTRLETSVQKAQDYDAGANRIEEKLDDAKQVRDVTVQLDAIKKLPMQGLVPPSRLSIERLQERAIEKMASLVESDCTKWEKLPAITDYKAHADHLQQVERDLTAAHRLELLERVHTAQANLKARREELESQNRDTGLLAEVSGMQHLSGLKALRGARARLDELERKAASPTTREVLESAKSSLDEKIQNLSNFAEGLKARLEALASPQESGELRDLVVRQSAHFENTPEAATLDKAAAQCRTISGLWRAIETAEAQLAGAVSQGPQELEEWRTAWRELTTRKGLNAPLRERLARGETEAAEAERVARERAAQWLQHQRDAFGALARNGAASSADLSALQSTLEAAPVWLDDAAQQEVAALRTQVETYKSEVERLQRAQQEADDAKTILARFRNIHDPQRRAEVLQQLRALQEELEIGAVTTDAA